MKILTKSILLGLLLVSCYSLKAQDTKQTEYLSKIGVVDSLFSEVLNENRKIYIQLPENYNQNNSVKYPVVYLLDGEILLPTVANIHNFYSGGFMPEFVLVGISNAKHRTRDLTPTKIKTKYGMPFNEENGESKTFLKFFESELIPYIENNYQVTNYRTLIGHSYGGLFVVNTFLNQTNLFANYIAIDPSLDWDNQHLLKEAETKIANLNLKNKALFMSLSGQLHMQNSAITINNVMQDTTDYTLFARSNISFSEIVKHSSNKALFFDWKFYPKDIHGTVVVPSLRDGLISVFEWFQMENTDKINSFDTSKEDLLSIITYREKKLEKHFGYFVAPYPEDLLNMSGYMNMDMQQLEKAKMYFELAVQYYPNSSNVYDSLADYYQSENNYKEALKNVEKAYQLNPTNYFKEKIEQLKNKL